MGVRKQPVHVLPTEAADPPVSSSRLDYKQSVSARFCRYGRFSTLTFQTQLRSEAEPLYAYKVPEVKHTLTTDQKEGVLLAFTLIPHISVKYEYTVINLHSLKE